jgi:hypothetical protein
MKYIGLLFSRESLKKFLAVTLMVPQLFLGCKTRSNEDASVKTLYGNQSSWIFWSKGAFVDIVPSIHRASDGTQTKYMCAYYGEGDPNFKPKNIPHEDFKTVWTTYSNGANRWQSAPLDPEAVKKAIDETPNFKKSRLAMHVGRFALKAPVWWVGSQMFTLPVAGYVSLVLGGSFFAPFAPLMFAVGGITVAFVGLYEAEQYQKTKGRIGDVDDTRSPLYDPGTIGEADPELDFRSLLKVLKRVPAMSSRIGISCKAPSEILRDVEKSGQIRDAVNWRGPELKAGVKLSCKSLNGRSFIMDRADAEPGLNVRLSDEAGTTINKFKYDELSAYLRRDGTVLSNIDKFRRASDSGSDDVAGNVSGLKKYVEDNAGVQSQFDLMGEAILGQKMFVVLTDLPSSIDMVDETCTFIKTKVSK